MLKRKKIVFILLPCITLFISLVIGRFFIPPVTVGKILASRLFSIPQTWPDSAESIVMNIRLPRSILAMLVGAGLSVSGASMQGMFRNPLVSPDILGVSSAAGFGAAMAILLSGSPHMIRIAAFAFGILGVLLTYSIGRVYKTTPLLMLVLAGVVVGSFFSALISITKFVADPLTKLPAITFWLMGSLSNTSLKDIVITLPLIVSGSIVLMALSWRLNILTMGEEEARSLGVRTELLKGIIIVTTTIIVASTVCVAGIIGWVGLVIPHISRMIVGANHRVLLPTTVSIGACYLLLIDDIARTVTYSEIPLGLLTAVVGAPFFAILLRQTKGGWK